MKSNKINFNNFTALELLYSNRFKLIIQVALDLDMDIWPRPIIETFVCRSMSVVLIDIKHYKRIFRELFEDTFAVKRSDFPARVILHQFTLFFSQMSQVFQEPLVETF